jgi:hypothetical protein
MNRKVTDTRIRREEVCEKNEAEDDVRQETLPEVLL